MAVSYTCMQFLARDSIYA